MADTATVAATRVDAFYAIADPTRRALLDLLREGERAVGELVVRFRITQPAISQHLRVLREAGLVVSRRVGRRRLYRLEAARLEEVAAWVAHYDRFWTGKLDDLSRYLDRQHGTAMAVATKGAARTLERSAPGTARGQARVVSKARH